MTRADKNYFLYYYYVLYVISLITYLRLEAMKNGTTEMTRVGVPLPCAAPGSPAWSIRGTRHADGPRVSHRAAV